MTGGTVRGQGSECVAHGGVRSYRDLECLITSNHMGDGASPLSTQARMVHSSPEVDCVGRQLRIWVALALLIGGLMWLVDQLEPSAGVFAYARQWWPVALIVLGLAGAARLVMAQNALRGPFIVALTGALLLFMTLDPLPSDVELLLWPALLILAGVGILIWLAVSGPTTGGRLVTRLVTVGEARRLTWPAGQFSLGIVTAVASGCVIDLNAAEPLDSMARLDITAIGSGVDVLVPDGWRVELRRSAVLGRCRDTSPSGPIDPSGPTLHVEAFAVFAGIQISRT